MTADAAALCVRAGNAVILRGGSECLATNLAIHAAVAQGLRDAGLPEAAVQIVRTTDRAAVGLMLTGLEGAVDLIIPRGGKSLVARVRDEARGVAVLGHLEGLVHVYLDKAADLEKAKAIGASTPSCAASRSAGPRRPCWSTAPTPSACCPPSPPPSPKPAANCAATRGPAAWSPAWPRPPRMTGAPNTWLRSWPWPSSTESRAPRPTSPNTARPTPTPSSPRTPPQPNVSQPWSTAPSS